MIRALKPAQVVSQKCLWKSVHWCKQQGDAAPETGKVRSRKWAPVTH